MKKVCVYAICKNEEAFVDRFYESVKDADGIYVLDTGSSDKTVEKLKSHGIVVKEEIIDPWRFDVARNKSLEMVPDDMDICVCLDLDEIATKGWKEAILDAWSDNTDRLRYVYNWFIENDVPKVTYYADKIHKRHGFKWVNPVHEVLAFDGVENQTFTDNVVIDHYPDRSKSRGSYLPLLELSVKENPLNDRNMHYLGREYMYYGRWNEAIDTLIKHLNLENATWKDERCASMRFIARCYKNMNRFEESKMWIDKAMDEAPHLRDPFVEAALLYYSLEDYDNVLKYANKALEIKENGKSYINEIFSYDETVYDLISIAQYNKGNVKEAIKYAELALEKNPENERIKNNLDILKGLNN